VFGINYLKILKINGDNMKLRELKESPNSKKDSKDYIEYP